MPFIKPDVLSGVHLRTHPKEREILVPFLTNFDVNNGYSQGANNTRVSAYLLAPDTAVKQQFGLTGEVLLVISDYPELQPRTLQAVERIMSEPPAMGRVDPTVFFLVTPDSKALSWMQTHGLLNTQSRIPVLFNTQTCVSSGSDSYLVRRAISDQLYSRDLFNDQLPLQSDLFFVGRDQIVAEYNSAIKQSQNRGLFGLRKTGKTSVLFKIRRLAERDGIIVLYYDCKDPAIRNLHWRELIDRIVNDLVKTNPKLQSSARLNEHASDKFKRTLSALKDRRSVAIIFDEIEHVSPLARMDLHWQTEFVDFWQTMWTTQSEVRNISFILSGVNPTIVEMDEINGIQNPVFSIVPTKYLTGLQDKEVGSLISHIGMWMGMKFTPEALNYIFKRYGGHPLLTRMACSHLHNFLVERKENRPVTISDKLLTLTQEDREADISQYSRHVVSELSSFYPDEYHMLEVLASGNIAEFIDFSFGNDFVRHLAGYGLVDTSAKAKPYIKIPMIGRYINQARAIKERTLVGPLIIAYTHRPLWLRDRVYRITADMRLLGRIAKEKKLPGLYGDNGFPEAERFYAVTVVDDLPQFESFINVCNRCFVEPLDNIGLASGKRDYFWKDIQTAFPDLGLALLRTKLYRHEKMHLLLKSQVEDRLKELLDQDFLGLKPDQCENPSFALQQMIIDGLFVGIQAELERLT